MNLKTESHFQYSFDILIYSLSNSYSNSVNANYNGPINSNKKNSPMNPYHIVFKNIFLHNWHDANMFKLFSIDPSSFLTPTKIKFLLCTIQIVGLFWIPHYNCCYDYVHYFNFQSSFLSIIYKLCMKTYLAYIHTQVPIKQISTWHCIICSHYKETQSTNLIML